jgi:nonsense-mediated mRNA decay protein 3
VGSHIHLTDPRTLQQVELHAPVFWKKPFVPLCTREHLRRFVVLDVCPLNNTHHPRLASGQGRVGGGDGGSGERIGGKDKSHGVRRATVGGQKLSLAEVTVARLSDFGKNDQTYAIVSHLGALLKAGDHVQGYDLLSRTIEATDYPSLKGRGDQVPEIVLVSKVYANSKHKCARSTTAGACPTHARHARGAREDRADAHSGAHARPRFFRFGRRRRFWRLKCLRKEMDQSLTAMDIERSKDDYESFLQDVAEDRDMRAEINLYKNPAAIARPGGGPDAVAAAAAKVEDGEEEDGLSEAEVGLEELLDDLTLADNETFDDHTPPTLFRPPGGAIAQFHFT